MESPLISCICITKNKPDLLARSIECFHAQTYPSKELLIVYERGDLATELFLRNHTENKSIITLVVKEKNQTLGYLRNRAIDLAKGDYICQWDDDDWYHTERLQHQIEVVTDKGYEGSILTQWLVFDTFTEKAYLSNIRLWEGSILCKRETIQKARYLDRRMGEDTAVIDLLTARSALQSCLAPWLYIYVYHGRNTWNREHWKSIFEASSELDLHTSQLISQILQKEVLISEASKMLTKILKPEIQVSS